MSDGLSRPALSFSRRLRQWMPAERNGGRWLLGLVFLVLVLLSLLGERGQLLLRYQREAVLQGEYWRLVTAHLVHGSTQHLLLNSAGLALIGWLFADEGYSWRAWLLIALFSIAAIDLGFVFFEPQLTWYLGLSGVLHGALIAGAMSWWRSQPKWLALLLSAYLVGKLTWEQVVGALPLSGDMPVVVDAHLYGSIGGALAGFILWVQAHRQVAVKSRI
jgi:rhomboid family GlyGly-CTERM serine protease